MKNVCLLMCGKLSSPFFSLLPPPSLGIDDDDGASLEMVFYPSLIALIYTMRLNSTRYETL